MCSSIIAGYSPPWRSRPRLAFASLPVTGAPLPFQNSAAEFDIDEQPGYVPPKEAEQLPDGFERQYVFFRTTEPPGSIIVHTGRAVSLSGSGQ